MKKLFYFLFFVSSVTSAQNGSYHEYIGTTCAFGTHIYPTLNSGSIILSSDIYHACNGIIRLTQTGSPLWIDVFDAIDDLIVLPDSTILCSGTNLGSLVLRKLDPGGNEIWIKSFSSADNVRTAFLEMQGNDLIVAGHTYLGPYALRIDTTGNIIWSNSYSINGLLSVQNLTKTSTGYLISGQWKHGTIFNDHSPYDPFILNIDSSGNVLWGKKYFHPFSGCAKNVEEIPGSGFLFTGNEIRPYDYNMAMTLIDNSGLVTWSKQFHCLGNILTGDIRKTTNGILGTLTTFNNSLVPSPVIYKFNNSGNILWAKKTDTINAGLSSAFVHSDGSFVTAGYLDIDSFDYSVYTVKTDSISFLNCDETVISMTDSVITTTDSTLQFTTINLSLIPQSISLQFFNTVITPTILCSTVDVNEISSSKILIYPNPSSHGVWVEMEKPEQVTLMIYDLAGQLVFEKNYSDNKEFIDIDLKPGIYFAGIKTKEYQSFRKLVFE